MYASFHMQITNIQLAVLYAANQIVWNCWNALHWMEYNHNHTQLNATFSNTTYIKSFAYMNRFSNICEDDWSLRNKDKLALVVGRFVIQSLPTMSHAIWSKYSYNTFSMKVWTQCESIFEFMWKIRAHMILVCSLNSNNVMCNMTKLVQIHESTSNFAYAN